MDNGHQRSYWDDYMSMSEDSDDDSASFPLHQPSLPYPELPGPNEDELSALFSKIRLAMPLPAWRGITLARFGLRDPPTPKEWAAVDISLRVVGHNIILYCTIPNMARRTQWVVALSLYAAQCAEELSGNLHFLDKTFERTVPWDGIALGAIFMRWWAHDNDARISRLGVFGEFVVYILGDDRDESAAKEKALTYAYQNLL